MIAENISLGRDSDEIVMSMDDRSFPEKLKELLSKLIANKTWGQQDDTKTEKPPVESSELL